MIERYTLPEMAAIWSEGRRLEAFQEVHGDLPSEVELEWKAELVEEQSSAGERWNALTQVSEALRARRRTTQSLLAGSEQLPTPWPAVAALAVAIAQRDLPAAERALSAALASDDELVTFLRPLGVQIADAAGKPALALERLDPEDPRVSRALALHLERTELLEQGERLLVAIQYDPAGNRIRPLIRGAQVVLRKVRHVPAPSEPAASPGASLSAIRQEVRHTGLLAACRDLLATEAPTDQAPEEAGETRDL